MTKTIRREILVPQAREQVWRALTESATLAEWMFPNDFVPRVGHRFTFQVPANPAVKFEGLTVRCEVLECEMPERLAFSWSAGGGGGAVENTRVSFRLEVEGAGTRVVLEHAGFEISMAFGEQAFKGAEYGWGRMLKQLEGVVAGLGDGGKRRSEKVHVFISTGRFGSFKEMRDYIDQTYNEDGDRIPSPFIREIGLSSFEPGCIEAMHRSTPITLVELLAGASYQDQWLSKLDGKRVVDSVICVFAPNRVSHPERSSLEYVGAFDYVVKSSGR